MKSILNSVIFLLLIAGCSTTTVIKKEIPNSRLVKSSFYKLPEWGKENHKEVLNIFRDSCKSKYTKKMYKNLCIKADENISNAKIFLESNFDPYLILGDETGLLTGYYEAELKGSLVRTDRYRYPIYTTPSDLITVDLSSIYPELKSYRLRGRLDGNRVIPYYSREDSIGKNSNIICYTDSKIDLFFLEIQGSGRVVLDSGDSIFIGYHNQNGHKYRAIGRYLVSIGALDMDKVSLQSIKKWLEDNPTRVDEVLNYNKSVVYFRKKENSATGSLGLELTPKRSVAIDRKFIPLGSMLYLNSKVDDNTLSRVVFAQDTGGAIKGRVRADIFLGFGEYAMSSAGMLKSPLKLWVILPKKSIDEK